ncbi:FHA domain-containing protein [Calothrix rhizosoleniae]|uniref:FHA domain-containing protein n=1 Tax=Calothrix rhizosoleniae TaxID=888997 RepID=UPI00135655AD|nr:FHA domain-containing protein [Calothrix rhizosoleniae]
MKVKISHAQALSEIQELDLSLETPRGKEYVIGRSPDADFVLDDPDVSRFHCKFFYKSGNYYFGDLGSRNGSIVNNKVIQQNQTHLLSDGDIIRIGDYVLVMEDTASMDQPAETVVRIINPALFAKNPSTKNIESEKPEVLSNQDVVNEVAEVDISVPIAEEVQTADEVEVINSETNDSVQIDSAVEITTPQPDLVAPQLIENKVVQTSEDESDTDSIATPDIPIAETEDSEAFATPEYTIVQSRNIVSEEAELIRETSEDVSDNLLDGELLDKTHVQERNQEEVSNQSEELSSSTTEEVESELLVADNVEIPTLEEGDIGIGESGESQNQEAEESVIDDAATIDANANPQIDELEEDIQSSSETEVLEDIPVVNEIVSTTEDEEVASVEETQPEEILETTSESQLPAVVTQKYTVLIAHESKQSELVSFVTKNQKLFSGCLTMTWDSVSESLEEKTGIIVSEAIPAATSGGYQRIASLINSDEILAVIFLRDLLQPQPGQANEETFLRLCNINQVLLATNLPTAEAVVCYMQHGLCD